MTPEEDHAAIWAAINKLQTTIDVNGYMDILKEIARRYRQRREVWLFFKKPRQMVSRALWIFLGGAAVAIANHIFSFWPTPR